MAPRQVAPVHSQNQPGAPARPVAAASVLSPPVPAPFTGATPRFQLQRVDPGNAIQRAALWFAIIFVFVRFSFLHELIAISFGVRSYLLPVFEYPAVVGLLVSGGVLRAVRNSPGRYFSAFAIWLILATPSSVWPGGSFSEVSTYFQTQLPAFFLIAGLVVRFREMKWMMTSIALAGIVNELSAESMRNTSGARLEVQYVTFGNANDLAAQLLLILPLCWFLLTVPKGSRIIRLLMIPGIGLGAYNVLLSGSRGALVAIVVVWIVLIFTTQGSKRLIIAAAAPVAAIVIFAILPASVMERYATLSDKTAFTGVSTDTSEAVSSAAGRRYLLMRSLEFTLKHPVFGVGPGQFANAEGGEAHGKGERGSWLQTHNLYTQVSSEAGIPAIAFLLAAMIGCIPALIKIRREAKIRNYRDLEAAAFALLLSLAAFGSAAFFLSLAWRFYIPALIGLSCAMMTVARNEFDSTPADSSLR